MSDIPASIPSPRPRDESVAYTSAISTSWPWYALRSIFHSCQPPEEPVAAFHVPVVPSGVHSSRTFVW